MTDDQASSELPWHRPGVLLALAAVLIGAFSAGLLVVGLPPGDASSEAGFARDMSVHHAQAVEMAELARDRTDDSGVRFLAIDIALGQQAQIGQMQGWLAVWGLPATGTQPAMTWMGHAMPMGSVMPGMATMDDLARLRDGPDGEADATFLQLMIRHHRGGVAMAEAVIERTQRPEVRRLAQAIVDGQTAEIRAMQDLLRRKGIATANEAQGMAPAGHTMTRDLVTFSPSSLGNLSLYGPLAMAAFAASWLGADAFRRRRARAEAVDREDVDPEGAHALAVGGLALASALHLGLWPAYAFGSAGTPTVFAAISLGMAVVGGCILAQPSPGAYVAGAGLATLATAGFVILRLVPVLTGMGSQPLDGAELVALVAGLTALACCSLLWQLAGVSPPSSSGRNGTDR